jgi:hypothetical protein
LGYTYTGEYSLDWHMARALKFAEIVADLELDAKEFHSKYLVAYVRAVLEDAGSLYRSCLVSKTVSFARSDTFTQPVASYLAVFELADSELMEVIKGRRNGSTQLAVRGELRRLGYTDAQLDKQPAPQTPKSTPRKPAPAKGAGKGGKGGAGKGVKQEDARDILKRKAAGQDGRRDPKVYPATTVADIGKLRAFCKNTQNTILFMKGSQVAATFQKAKVVAEIKRHVNNATEDTFCLSCLCSNKDGNACFLMCNGSGPRHATFTSEAHAWPPELKTRILQDPHFRQP